MFKPLLLNGQGVVIKTAGLAFSTITTVLGLPAPTTSTIRLTVSNTALTIGLARGGLYYLLGLAAPTG